MEFPESEPLLSKAESFATGHSLLVTPKSTWYGLLNRFLLAHQQENLRLGLPKGDIGLCV